MDYFFKRLSYSIGNEDWATEQKALQIAPGDTVLTVTASGDRPLNLLFTECKSIISIDANPFQTALCDLKKAALAHLNYDEYLSFLGLTHHSDRLSLLKKLEGYMEGRSVACWRKHPDKIKQGISYQGQVEKLCRNASRVIKTIDGKKIDALFSCGAIGEQQHFIREKWNWKAWKRVIDFALHPLFTRFFVKDPGLYEHVDATIRPSTYLYNRLEMALNEFPVKENLILSLVFQGKVFKEGFSPHLQENESQQIKKNLSKLKLETTNLIAYLESASPNSIDCFSLSDVISYMDRKTFEHLCGLILKAAKPNARFCLRQFMSAYEFPKEFEANFKRNTALEKELESEDRCFVYRFNAGTIVK